MGANFQTGLPDSSFPHIPSFVCLPDVEQLWLFINCRCISRFEKVTQGKTARPNSGLARLTCAPSGISRESASRFSWRYFRGIAHRSEDEVTRRRKKGSTASRWRRGPASLACWKPGSLVGLILSKVMMGSQSFKDGQPHTTGTGIELVQLSQNLRLPCMDWHINVANSAFQEQHR